MRTQHNNRARNAIGTALVLLLAAGSIMIYRAAQLRGAPAPTAVAKLIAPLPGAADRLAQGVRFATVSTGGTNRDERVFGEYRGFLARAYPKVHVAAPPQLEGTGALLFTLHGSDRTLAPLLLAAHMDVVPVERGTEAHWSNAPFSGKIADGFVWGRGALDDKAGVHGVLEAVEALLASGFHPRRTLYLAFGADEEAGGSGGAAKIAERLAKADVHPAMVLDEGGAITDGIVPGVRRPMALAGIAEKGYLSVELIARGKGGHSSMPPRETAAGRVARAAARVEEHPFPATIGGVAALNLKSMAGEMPFVSRLAIANLWLFGPMVRRQLSHSPETDAMLRTTTAVTMLEGSPKDNVLPFEARAVINFRMLPGDSIPEVLDHVRQAIGDDAIEIKAQAGGNEATPVSPIDSEGWRVLAATIRQVFPEAAVAPNLTLGSTDARYYAALSSNVYRFLPCVLKKEDLPRIHGANERVRIADFSRAIQFYAELIRAMDGG